MPKVHATITPVAARFSIAQTIDGYEVTDQDGRAVSDAYPTANRPLGIAARLNTAAASGQKALARAFGVVENDDDDLIAFDPDSIEAICHEV